MPVPNKLTVPRIDQLLVRVLAYDFMEAVTRLASLSLFHRNQRLIYQCAHQPQSIAIADCLRGLQRPATCEDGELPQEGLFWLAEQSPTPIHRSLQGLLTCQADSAATCQQ